MYNNYKKYDTIQTLIVFIIIIFASSIIFSVLGTEFLKLLFNDINIHTPYSKEDVIKLKIITIFSHIGTFIIPPFILLFIIKVNPLNFFEIKKLNRLNIVGIILFFLGSIIICEWLLQINKKIDFSVFSTYIADKVIESQFYRDKIIEAFIDKSYINYIFNIIILAIIPAFGEELTFRGVLQPIIIKLSNKANISIIFTAFLFAFIHFQFLDFLPRFFIGIAYGYIYYYSKNIILTIVLHFLNNFTALSIFFYYIKTQQIIPKHYEINTLLICLGVILISTGFFYILKTSKVKLSKQHQY